MRAHALSGRDEDGRRREVAYKEKRGKPWSMTTQCARDIYAGAAQSMRVLMECRNRSALDVSALMSIDRRFLAA